MEKWNELKNGDGEIRRRRRCALFNVMAYVDLQMASARLFLGCPRPRTRSVAVDPAARELDLVLVAGVQLSHFVYYAQ